MKSYKTKIIAHRGASFDAPENTIPALELAWKQKIQKVEIDIHMTKDRRIVAIHDSNTSKISVKNLSIKEESFLTLQSIDAGLWKGEKWKHTKIPCLEEVLATLPLFGTLILEIKCGLECIAYLKEIIIKTPVHQIEFISFNLEVLTAIKKQLPLHKTLWLLDLDYTPETVRKIEPLKNYIEKTKKANIEGLNLWAGKIANKEYIEKIKQHNLLVYIWSTNSPKTAKYFLNLEVDAITTDRPYWLLKKLKEKDDDKTN